MIALVMIALIKAVSHVVVVVVVVVVVSDLLPVVAVVVVFIVVADSVVISVISKTKIHFDERKKFENGFYRSLKEV